MNRPDDCSLSQSDPSDIRKHADRLLKDAGGYGRFPTPIGDIIAAAKLNIDYEAALDESFLRRVYKKVTDPIRRAVDKVLGIFGSRDRMIYLDQTVHNSKQAFIKLHETGHGYLPWRRDTFAFMEDGESTLDPEITEVFERQANVFASEVLFQLDLFQQDANSRPFEIKTPLALAPRYSASAYATIRRYVTTSQRACAVLVLDPPVSQFGVGNTYSVRRSIQSTPFTAKFGKSELAHSLRGEGRIGGETPPGPVQTAAHKEVQDRFADHGLSRKVLPRSLRF